MYGPTGSTTGSTEDQDKGKEGEEGRGQKGSQCFLKVSSPDDFWLQSFDLKLDSFVYVGENEEYSLRLKVSFSSRAM